MGKVEKVIVLSVLFLIALILVVSLTVDDPLNKARVVEAGAPKADPTPTPIVPATASELAAVQAQKDATPLLSTQVVPPAATPNQPAPAPAVETPVAAPVVPAPVAVAPSLPPGALLKKLDGLQDSILPDMKLYTWKEGDSYRSIAQNYYGNVQKLTVLKRSNEGRNDVQPGQQIFIPVFDTDAGLVASTAKSTPDAGAGAAKPVAASGRIHVVKEGESLWKIAKAELGKGERWNEIYEQNRDLLAKPESVHKGMRLRLP
jgi:nucleoid-associated protein YgaU